MEGDGILLQIGEDGVVRKYEEPYATIECPTEEDFNNLVSASGKQVAEKPRKLESGECECVTCSVVLKAQYAYCPECGQKIDWEA